MICRGGRALAQVVPQAVFGAGSRLAGNFSDAVAVQVVNHKLSIMCSGPDINTQIDAPELFSLQGISVQVNIAGIARLGIVFGVGRIPFYHQIVAAVIVQVTCTHIAGSIAVTFISGSNSALGPIQADFFISLSPDGDRRRLFLLHSIHHGSHSISAAEAALSIGVVGNLQSFAVEL